MIKYYYLIYLERNDKTEIHMIPFDTKEEALEYKQKADKFWTLKNQLKRSKILTRDFSKYSNEFWL